MRTSKTLIEKIRDQQDEKSWDEFASYYSRYIYVVVRNMNLSHHDTEDVAQQVLLKAWKGLPNFEYEPSKHRFRSWLCTITKNTVRSFMKLKSTKMRQLCDSEKKDCETYISGITLPEIDQIAVEEWENYLANLALANVKERFQENVIQCFELFAEGLSAAEVSEKIGQPVNTVHVNKKRVQNALYKEILRLDHELG